MLDRASQSSRGGVLLSQLLLVFFTAESEVSLLASLLAAEHSCTTLPTSHFRRETTTTHECVLPLATDEAPTDRLKE